MFITNSYFSVTKNVKLNSTHYSIKKINSKTELQNIATNHSADIDYKDFMKIYRECTKKLYSFLAIDGTLPASNPLIIAKSSNELGKYEFLTGEDLGYKPSLIEVAKFDYSPPGKFLIRDWIKMINKKDLQRY